jgi:hypothetical protein
MLVGVVDETARQRLRRRRKIQYLSVVPVWLAVVLLDVIYGTVIDHHLGHWVQQYSDVGWRQALSGWLLAAGGVAGVAGYVRTRRATAAGGAGTRWPIEVLARAERRALIRQVRGQQPADPDHLALARDLALRRTRQGTVRLVTVGGVLVMVGAVVESGRLVDMFPFAVFAAFFVFGGVWVTRDLGRVRRFLDEHPVPPATEAPDPV